MRLPKGSLGSLSHSLSGSQSSLNSVDEKKPSSISPKALALLGGSSAANRSVKKLAEQFEQMPQAKQLDGIFGKLSQLKASFSSAQLPKAEGNGKGSQTQLSKAQGSVVLHGSDESVKVDDMTYKEKVAYAVKLSVENKALLVKCTNDNAQSTIQSAKSLQSQINEAILSNLEQNLILKDLLLSDQNYELFDKVQQLRVKVEQYKQKNETEWVAQAQKVLNDIKV